MVSGSSFFGRIARRAGAEIRADLGRLGARLGALRPRRGVRMRHWRFETPEGRVRLHLRVHEDGTGVLWRNVTDALLLGPQQVEMAEPALDDTPADRALVRLRTFYPGVRDFALRSEYDRMAAAMRKLRQPAEGCVICELGIPQPPPLSVRAQAPYKADLALSYACNNDCAHCYNEPERREMRSLNVEHWWLVLERLWDIGVPYVILTGGEPTLHPDLLDLVEHAEFLGQVCGMNTNGRRLADRELVERLTRAGLDHVQITLASHRREPHNRIVRAEAYDETVAGIRNALDAGLHTITNTTLTEDNAADAEAIIDFLAGLGLTTFAMNGIIHSGRGTDHPDALSIERLRQVVARVRDRAGARGMRFIWYTVTRHCELSPAEMGLGLRFCNAAEYSVCVEPNGDVLPCQSYYQPAGNILRDDWESIWESDLFTSIRFRREHPERSDLPPECHDCEHLRLCGGGCPLELRARRGEVMSRCQTGRTA
ncbi:MAG: radical SAM protein [Armatimonadota bacterium]|nr:radical SAM protein [Armatimonadota bacterium]